MESFQHHVNNALRRQNVASANRSSLRGCQEGLFGNFDYDRVSLALKRHGGLTLKRHKTSSVQGDIQVQHGPHAVDDGGMDD